MKLLELYKELLKTANLVTTADGFVSRQFGDITKPAMIKGKRIVLPTPEHLANPDWSERIVFHPLSENILRSESAVLEEFRTSLNVKLNFTIGMLAYNLLVIATSVAEHSKLNPDQLEFLSKLKNADEKTIEVFQKLLKAMSVDQHQNVFVHIYLKRGGTINKKRHSRVGNVTFPFYNELLKGGDVYGVKLRVKDRETLTNLMEYMFPQIDEAESHNRGSDSDVAPYLDALMKAFMSVASPINDQLSLFGNMIDDVDNLTINDAWVETFDNLAVMIPEIRMIPMQAGNEGAAPTAAAQPAAVATPPAIQPSPLPSVLTQPAPLPAWQQPYVQQQYTQQQAPGPVKTARGLDFASLERSIPALAHPVMSPVGGQTQMYGNPNTPPRWDTNSYQQRPAWPQQQTVYQPHGRMSNLL